MLLVSRLFPPGFGLSSTMLLASLVLLMAMAACGLESREYRVDSELSPPAGLSPLTLPALEAIEPAAGRLRVVATTGIIADVVAEVGGEYIQLTALMGPAQDPHSFQPTAQQMVAASEAAVIFVHGWGLEETLLDDLANSVPGTPRVPVAAGIDPLPLSVADGDLDNAPAADPHTWMDPDLVRQWVHNVSVTLSALDPANASAYRANAEAYKVELAQLISAYDVGLGRIPSQRRLLVTNHDSLGYLARAYDFEVIGTVLSGASTLAEPSAAELASLVAQMEAAGLCTIFAETTATDEVAHTVAGELDSCPKVEIVRLHTGALGNVGSNAETYLDMMNVNLEMLLDAYGVDKPQS